jgi:hypothetical protein
MGGLTFGETARCRTCRGTGLSRNPDWGNKARARERARLKRQGLTVEKPKAITACVECGGKGYMPVAEVDAPLDYRDQARASLAESL